MVNIGGQRQYTFDLRLLPFTTKNSLLPVQLAKHLARVCSIWQSWLCNYAISADSLSDTALPDSASNFAWR